MLKQIFKAMASMKDNSLTPLLHGMSVLRRTPSLEDSDYSSSVATVNAKVIDDEDDATSPPPTSARIDIAPSSSAPPNNNDNPAASPTPHEDE